MLEYFHHSGSSFGVDHLELIELVQARYANCLAALGLGFPDKENVLMDSASCFGFGFKKLHKSIQDMLRELDYKGVLLSMQELAGDDQRRLSFMSLHNNKFANAFPLVLAPDAFWRFNTIVFSTAVARKLGLPVPLLASHIGVSIKTEGRSAHAIVDPYGNGVAGAPGVTGGHTRDMHDAFQRFIVMAAKKAGISVKGSSQVDT